MTKYKRVVITDSSNVWQQSQCYSALAAGDTSI